MSISTIIAATGFMLAGCHSTPQPAAGQAAAVKDSDSLVYLVQQPEEKTAATPVILLLHGYGSDENDLFELRNIFPKNFLVISARAPITIQQRAYMWFHNTTINGQPDADPTDLEDARTKINELIATAVHQYKADPKQVYIAGFSQGAILSYMMAFTDPGKIKGIGVFSGKILPSLKKNILSQKGKIKTAVFVGHGDIDDRIPYTQAMDAVKILKTLNIPYTFHTYKGMRHEISDQEIKDFQDWLGKTQSSKIKK